MKQYVINRHILTQWIAGTLVVVTHWNCIHTGGQVSLPSHVLLQMPQMCIIWLCSWLFVWPSYKIITLPIVGLSPYGGT